MKKILATIILSGITILNFSACGNQDTVTDTLAEDIVTIINVEQVTEEKSVYEILGLPDTKEELFKMNLADFKAAIEINMPGYRTYFKVPDNYVLKDSDWENFREILSIKFFGDAFHEVENEEDKTVQNDPDSIYYAPTKEYLDRLTDEEFMVYLSELQMYNYPDSEPVDYSGLTPDQIKEVKAALIPVEE